MNDSAIARRLHAVFNGDPVTPVDRLYALGLKGITQRQIAQSVGVTFQSVNDCLYDRVTSYNIATAIAQATGVPLKKLWPDGRYARPPRQQQRERAA